MQGAEMISERHKLPYLTQCLACRDALLVSKAIGSRVVRLAVIVSFKDVEQVTVVPVASLEGSSSKYPARERKELGKLGLIAEGLS